MNNNRKAKAKYIHDAGKRNLGRKKLEAMFIKKMKTVSARKDCRIKYEKDIAEYIENN